ncbi:MAG TPA: MEDS domain-containing protein [Terracidiphilus sp.]|nr:MEDS domain-containing protein [Terracidiphilus sp.]
METVEQPIHFANETLGSERHICAFFHSPEEEYRVLMPFIREGIERGEKAFHIVDPRLVEDHLGRLREAGIDADSAQSKGQLIVKRWQDAYLRDGHFDQDGMVALVEEMLSTGRAEGYAHTRAIGHMEWALEDFPGVSDLVEYETRLNFVLPKYKDPVICTYDCSKFGAGVAMDILRTHPMVIVGGVLQRNPFFVPPAELLAELRERGAYSSRAVA